MFGRKKIMGDQKRDELQVIKNQIEQPQQVPVQEHVPENLEKSPFSIVRKTSEQRQKIMYSQSGQQIKTGEVENIEVIDTIYEMSLDDVIDIISYCREAPIGLKFRKLLKEM